MKEPIAPISKTFTGYSLSWNYQIKENVLAMHLILPLDLSYVLFYSLYNGLVILIRGLESGMSGPDYYFYYDMANMVRGRGMSRFSSSFMMSSPVPF
jgi:hypothetical protein